MLFKPYPLTYKTHDLIYLLKKCSKYDKSLKKVFDDASVLNEYAISTRYPVDFDEERTVEEAKAAYRHLINIRNKVMTSIQKDLNKRTKDSAS